MYSYINFLVTVFLNYWFLQCFNLILLAPVLSDCLTPVLQKKIEDITYHNSSIFSFYYSKVPFLDVHLSSLLHFLSEEDVPCLIFRPRCNLLAPQRPCLLIFFLIYSIFNLSIFKLFSLQPVNEMYSFHLSFIIAKILDSELINIVSS